VIKPHAGSAAGVEACIVAAGGGGRWMLIRPQVPRHVDEDEG
jgi:hypothetical protein